MRGGVWSSVIADHAWVFFVIMAAVGALFIGDRLWTRHKAQKRPFGDVTKDDVSHIYQSFMHGRMYETLHEWSRDDMNRAVRCLLAMGRQDIADAFVDVEQTRVLIKQTLQNGGDLEDFPVAFAQVDEGLTAFHKRISVLKAQEFLSNAHAQLS